MAINSPIDQAIADKPSPGKPAGSPVASPADYAYCQKLMVQTSRNYTFASRLFPKSKQPHVSALYAMLRIGDDRVDVSHNGFDSRRAAIEDWERSYWQAFETMSSPYPVLRAFVNTAIQFNLPKEIMAPYFRAMKDDLVISRYPTFADLFGYMEGSAITVGRAMTYILGVKPGFKIDDCMPGADSLAIAMQLSNFWRDIGYDWNIGRLYLPLEDMTRFAVREQDLAEKRITRQFIALLEYEFERTEQYYAQARPLIGTLQSGQWAVASSLEIYRDILHGIRRNHYDVFQRKARSSTLRLFSLVMKARWQTLGAK
jgi:phytoene synthase